MATKQMAMMLTAVTRKREVPWESILMGDGSLYRLSPKEVKESRAPIDTG